MANDSRLDGLADRYRVVRTLAEGALSVIHEGVDVRTGAPVAIKVLAEPALRDAGARVRFEREIRASAKLRGRHVVRLVDSGALADGVPYMVMELLEGKDLASELKARGTLPIAEACVLLLQVACGVAEAHRHGIVHRDLKPANVFLARGGASRVVKVLDFGIAKLGGGDDAGDEQLTRSFSTLGTPAYMSPEQIRTPRSVDRATDVWAFGLLLFRALVGRLPFSGNASSMPLAICEDPPESLRALRPDAPVAIAEAIEGALEKDRRLRPTLADLGDVLIDHAGDDPLAHDAYAELARLSLSDLKR